MSQNSRAISCAQDGSTYTDKINQALQSIDECHSGAADPILANSAEISDGKLWLDTSGGDYVLKIRIGSNWVILFDRVASGTNMKAAHAEESDKWATSVSIDVDGDADGSASFDGSETTPISLSVTVNQAAKLTTARTITLTGDLGGTLSFDGSSATNNFEATIQPSSVENSMMADNSVDTAEIVDNAITLAKLQTLSKGDIVVGSDSGDPAVINGTSGQILKTDSTGNAVWDEAPSSACSQIYTSGSGTFTVPPGITTIYVTAGGAGGGGMGQSMTGWKYNRSCASGGQGAQCWKYAFTVTGGSNLSYSVGVGGSNSGWTQHQCGSGTAATSTTFGSMTLGGGGGGIRDSSHCANPPTAGSGGSLSGVTAGRYAWAGASGIVNDIGGCQGHSSQARVGGIGIFSEGGDGYNAGGSTGPYSCQTGDDGYLILEW